MIKKDRRFVYLPPVTGLDFIFLKGNEDWSNTSMVIYHPTKGKKDPTEPDPASGSYQMFWPINPWTALDA